MDQKTAQHRVHPTGGSRRVFEHVSGLKLVPSKCVASSRPPAGNAHRWAVLNILVIKKGKVKPQMENANQDTRQYRINLAGFGLEDADLLRLEHGLTIELEITRKGEIWNKRTGKKYEENSIRLLDFTTYEMGFSPKIDDFINILEANPILKDVFRSCELIELQIRVTMRGDEVGIPSIHISSDQMRYLSQIGARIDVDLIRIE